VRKLTIYFIDPAALLVQSPSRGISTGQSVGDTQREAAQEAVLPATDRVGIPEGLSGEILIWHTLGMPVEHQAVADCLVAMPKRNAVGIGRHAVNPSAIKDHDKLRGFVDHGTVMHDINDVPVGICHGIKQHWHFGI
jgi:hypothetical protein